MLDKAHSVIGGIYRVMEKITGEIPITNTAYNGIGAITTRRRYPVRKYSSHVRNIRDE
jgi:hypothetical protein